MKRWLTHSLVVLAILIASCDFGPINSAVDDFNIVVELEDINTGFSIGVFDSDTKEILDRDVTITFDSVTAFQTIDIFSDPLPEITFDGGFVNVGIRNEIVPTLDNPFDVSATIQLDGYLPQEISFTLSDTGATSYNIDMLSTSNLQGSYVESEILAPLDVDGNPLPIPLPFDSTTGELVPFASKLITNNNSENVWFPSVSVQGDGSIDDVKWNLSNGQSFIGNPAGYVITAYTWNPNTPEFNRGNVGLTTFGGGIPISTTHNDRVVLDVLEIKVKGVNTSFSTVSSIQSEDPNISDDELGIRMKSIVFTPDRSSNWHESNNTEDGIIHTIFSKIFLVEDQVPNVQLINWLYSDQSLTSLAVASLNEQDKNWLTSTFESGEIGFVNPYLFAPGDFISQLFFGADVLISNKTLPQFNSGLRSHSASAFYTYAELIDEVKVRIETSFMLKNDLLIKSDGRSIDPRIVDNHYIFYDVPRSPAIISFTLGSTTYTEYIDLTNYLRETITITPPPVSQNLITANVKANIRCKSTGSKELNINGFPINNIAIRYREVGATNSYPQVGSVEQLNYNADAQVLESVDMVFPGVEIGKTYDFIFSVDAFSERTTETIQSENFEIDVEVRDAYCQDK